MPRKKKRHSKPRMVERMCEFCGLPMQVAAKTLTYAEKHGLTNWGKYHNNCAQTVRTMGHRNPNYKGGKRSYRTERIRPEHRAVIRERDGNRCLACGRLSDLVPGGICKLDIHHVIPVRNFGPDIDCNLASLCRKCHNRIEHGRQIIVWPPPSWGPLPPRYEELLRSCHGVAGIHVNLPGFPPIPDVLIMPEEEEVRASKVVKEPVEEEKEIAPPKDGAISFEEFMKI